MERSRENFGVGHLFLNPIILYWKLVSLILKLRKLIGIVKAQRVLDLMDITLSLLGIAGILLGRIFAGFQGFSWKLKDAQGFFILFLDPYSKKQASLGVIPKNFVHNTLSKLFSSRIKRVMGHLISSN